MNRALLLAAAAAIGVACNKGDAVAPVTGFVQGVVRDTANAAMDQVSVRLRNSGSTVDLQVALTSDSGEYSFLPVTPGTYEVYLVVPAATSIVGPNPKTASVAASLTEVDFSLTLDSVRFGTHVQPVFDGFCVGCHATAGGAPMGLKLTSDSSYALLVGDSAVETKTVLRVKPNLPDSSYLLFKLLGTQGTVGGSGGQMPLGAPALPARTVRMLRRWVAAGALNN